LKGMPLMFQPKKKGTGEETMQRGSGIRRGVARVCFAAIREHPKAVKMAETWKPLQKKRHERGKKEQKRIRNKHQPSKKKKGGNEKQGMHFLQNERKRECIKVWGL